MSPRTLKYVRQPDGSYLGREKGVDVALAIALVRKAVFEPDCDVCILVSADTDLLPALELIVERRSADAIEVASWVGGRGEPAPLRLEGHKVRQHHLSERIYSRFKDTTPYARSAG